LSVPFAGVVVRRHADAGQMLQPGMPVLDVRSDGAREVLTAVPESRLAALAGARAELAVGDGAWRPARLARIEGMTDAATRTRVAHFVVTDGAALEPGAYARVRLAGAGDAAPAVAAARLSVPASALVRRGALAGVYVVADGRARLRWLRLGGVDDDRADVLAGLWPEDQVALDPSRLADGAPVRVLR
jgi:multidrug efflux pump subunit AcrA (membrane-fusion protein)